jgi:hypothetical protein
MPVHGALYKSSVTDQLAVPIERYNSRRTITLRGHRAGPAISHER